MNAKPSHSVPAHRKDWSHALTWLCLILSGLALLAQSELANAATSLTMHPRGTDPEGFQKFELQWNAISNATYAVQISTNLESGSWETIDLVTPAGDVGSYKVPPSIRGVIVDKKLFSRLVLPQPLITAVEPAIFPPGEPVNAYVIGQCFATNDVVRVDGVPVPGMVHLNPNQLHGPLPPLTSGQHLVELVRDGSVLSSFTVTCADPVVNPELVLQGPPGEPPASPSGLWLSKKGYEYYRNMSDHASARKGYNYYQAKSDINAAGLHHNPYFSNNELSGEIPWEKDMIKGGGGDQWNENDIVSDRLQARDSCRNHIAVGGDRSNRYLSSGGVSPFSGEVQECAVDLVIPGRGLDLTWARTYRSRTGPNTEQGAGWDFSYNVSLSQNGDGTITLRPGNGRVDTFYPNGTNGWARDEYFCEIRDLNGDSMPDVLFGNSGKWIFNPAVGNFAPGKLWKITDPNNNTITLDYDGSGRLSAIVDDLGRTNTVSYNSVGRISSVTDFSGRTIKYEYDSNGDLRSVVSPSVVGTPTRNDFPGGITNRYTYTSGNVDPRLNHNLTSCTDGLGQTWLSITYQSTTNTTSVDFDRVDQLICGETDHFRSFPQTPSPANNFATVKTIIRDAVGNVMEVFCDARGRLVRQVDYTGRAPNLIAPTTEVDNRPVNKLRATDPDYFETKWSWNRDSLCTVATLPDGAQMRYVYHQEFGPTTPRKKGDLRVMHQISSSGPVDLDGDGVGDTDELTWHFEYDPRFGAATRTGKFAHGGATAPKGYARTVSGVPEPNGVAINTKGTGAAKGRIASSQPAIVENKKGLLVHFAILGAQVGSKYSPRDYCVQYHESDFDFATRVTDPRGNLTTADYDPNGNCNRYSRRSGALTTADYNYRYNSHGQLTEVTNAADANGYRPVTRFVYSDDPFTPSTEPPVPFFWMSIEDAGPAGLNITNQYFHDVRGNVVRTIDPLGHDWLYHYNALDQLIRTETPTNLISRSKTDLLYNAAGNVQNALEELWDADDSFVRNVVTGYEYDELDQPTAVIQQVSPGVHITNKFFYNGIGELTFVQSPLAASGIDPHAAAQFEYDERGLLFREIGAPGSGSSPTNEWSYTAAGQPATKKYVDDTTSRTTTFTYDGFASSARWTPLVPKPRDPGFRLRVWQLMQGQNGSAMQIGPNYKNNKCDKITSQTQARLSQITDPMGNVTVFNYDANSNLKMVRHYGERNDSTNSSANVLLAQSQYQYDALNRLTLRFDRHIDVAGNTIGDGYRTTSFAYAPNENPISITDDLGRVTSFYYDTAGRGTNVTSPEQRTSFAILLNSRDEAIKCTQTDRSDLGGPPQVFICTNIFDALGRCVSTVDNVGNSNSVAFDSLNRAAKQRDAKNNLCLGYYDDLDRETLTVRDLNGDGLADLAVDANQSYAYDDNSRLVAMTDANTNTTYVSYDSLDHPVQLTLADGTHRSLIWSPRSNLIRQEDANGTVISNAFDLLDRCIARTVTPGAGVADTTTFTRYAYDGFSRIIAATNNAAHSEFSFDSLGNCTASSHNGWLFGQLNDALGRCLAVTNPSGRIITYAYNSLDQVTNVSSSPGIGQPFTSLATMDYEGPGRIGRIVRDNGINTRITWNGVSGVANAQGDFGWQQVSGINHQVAGGGAVIDRRVMSYDRNQNKTSRRQIAPFAQGQPMLTNTWNYDALNRMTYSFTVKPTMIEDVYEFTLDGKGNRQVVASNGVAQPYFMDATPLPGPADFQMNQYTVTPFGAQIYDDNGNVAGHFNSAQQLAYAYDFANRLVTVTDVTSGSAVPVASYAYGPFGERVSKTVYSTNAMLPPVVTEYICNTTQGEVCYLDGDDDGLSEIRVDGALIDSLIQLTDDGLASFRFHNGAAQQYLCDDLGNTLALADSDGGVIERVDYGDFGEPRFLNNIGLPTGANSSPAGNPFLFRGMEWHVETGSYHDAGTQYDSRTGRFMTSNIRSHSMLGCDRSLLTENPWTNDGGSESYVLKKEEGGRHTPFHNKYRPQNAAGKVSRSILKTFFETGDKPTQTHLINGVNLPKDKKPKVNPFANK